jgi:hypothetical protein
LPSAAADEKHRLVFIVGNGVLLFIVRWSSLVMGTADGGVELVWSVKIRYRTQIALARQNSIFPTRCQLNIIQSTQHLHFPSSSWAVDRAVYYLSSFSTPAAMHSLFTTDTTDSMYTCSESLSEQPSILSASAYVISRMERGLFNWNWLR